MGWYGTWNLEYTGKNNTKFLNTAKLIIANFKKRFTISDDKNTLDAMKVLSWYSADMDIEKILSYLEDGDQIHVLIDGETHPIREVISEGRYVTKEGKPNENNYDWAEIDKENGETIYHFNERYIEPEYDYCEYEEQTYRKENGKVTMECEFTDCDRYKSDRHGMKGAFIYELAYPEQAREETEKGGYTDTLDTYIAWIAQEMGNNEEMLPIIQGFMNEIMNISKDEVIEEEGQINEEAFVYFNEIKDKFKSLESTRTYLSEIKEKLPQKQKDEKMVLPELFANMSKGDIKNLGGIEVLIRLYEKEGKQKTREILEMLGYDLDSGLKEKSKKKSSIEKKKAKNEVNKNIKQSVIDYFLGCVKKKYPNLTPENEKRFVKSLGKTIDYKLEHDWGNANISIDYDPCEELISAFYSMDMSNFDSGLPIYDVFPIKTTVFMERGKSATVNNYGESEILYITDDYKQELLTSVNTRIMREEAKIPQEIKDGFEQEYQAKIEALNIKREQLVKKEEETQIILDQKKALEDKARKLIESYSSRIAELNSQNLSDSQKEQRKQKIIKEIKQIEKASMSNKFMEQLDEIQEKYGPENLQTFDKMHEEILNKEKWLKQRKIQYAKEENNKIWEKHKKEHPNDFSWPDTSSVPSELNELYKQKDEIIEYDKKQKEKVESQETQTENQTISKEQQKFVEALGNAYAQYIKESGNIDEYSFKNDRKQILADAFAKYFSTNYQNLTNQAFLINFENGPMRNIAEKYGFRRNSYMFGDWMPNLLTNIAHVKVSEGLIYSIDGILDKVQVAYATQESIQKQIDKLNSEIQFMQDAEEDSWNLRKLKNQRDSFVSYQNQLQGKGETQQSLEQLDQQKYFLEELDEKTTKLLQQYNKTQPEIDNSGIEFDN